MHCWFCLLNTRLLLSAVMSNSQQCGKWLFSITCDGKQSFSTLLAVCHHCWQKQPVFDKQSQHCMCRQLCARPDPKGSERTCYSSRGRRRSDLISDFRVWTRSALIGSCSWPITRLKSKNESSKSKNERWLVHADSALSKRESTLILVCI